MRWIVSGCAWAMFAACLAPMAFAAEANAGTRTLEGACFMLGVDSQKGAFSLVDRASKLEFVQRINPPPSAERARFLRVENAPFGAAEGVEITDGHGDATVFVVYPSQPFIFLQARHTNLKAESELVPHLGLPRIPLSLAAPASALKALGTAGLTAPEANPGSYTFLAVADPTTRAGVVAAWLTQERGSGVLFTGMQDGAVAIEARCEYGGLPLDPGATLESEWLVLGYFADARLGLEHYADAVAEYYHIALPPQPCGYCTWYSDHCGAASDQEHVKELANFAAQAMNPYGFSFLQIDDQWQGPPRDGQPLNAGTFTEEYLGKPKEAKDRWWNGPCSDFTSFNPAGPFGEGGMKLAASNIRAAGLRPGLWLLPFAWNPTCEALKDHHDYFAKRADGSIYYAFWAGWCLDMTNPAARDFLGATIRRICGDWQFGYLKLDGLWTGMATSILYINNGYGKDDFGEAVFHDERMTPVEAYRAGLKVVREAAGENTFLLGCNVAQNMRTLGASFGLVDAMRIGPDNGQDWGGLTVGPWHGTNRYFLNGRVWYNDPDPVYVRASLPIEQARLICSWAALSGQLTVSSDWLPEAPAERLDILRRAMPSHRLPSRPVDYFEQEFPRVWQVIDTKDGARRDVIGLFNWSKDASAEITVTCAQLGLPENTEFACFDFWQNAFLPAFTNKLVLTVPPASCQVLAVHAMADHPFVLSTSRHVTQGGIDLASEAWNEAEHTLQGTSAVIAGDPYELRILVPPACANRNVRAFTVDKQGVITSLAQKDEELRATLTASESGPVSWKITFQAAR